MAFINLNKQLKSTKYSSKGNKKKWVVRLVITLVVLFVAIYLPVRSAYQNSKSIMQNARFLSAGAKQENLDQMKQGITATKASVDGLNGSLNWLFWLRAIPFVGGYYSDMKHLVSAASDELEAAQIITDSLTPYKDELGLTGQATAGQDRVAQAVKILDKVLPNVDKVEPQLRKARDEVADIDTGKYPEKFGSTSVRSRMEEAKNFIIGAHIAITDNKQLIQEAPSILGAKGSKNYLLLFQNDKELRATGGFITAYAFLKIDQGHLSTTSSDDIYRLDERLLKACQSRICPLAPPAPIVKYLPEADGKPRTAWSMRDSNLSPDFPTSAKEFENMYSMLGDGTSFDGIITIDTQVVEELIALTGPIDVFGTTYSANTDPRCNCANVIYELEHYAEIASKGEADRKAVLGTLMQQLLAKLLGSGTDKLPDFINTGIQLASDKHIMLYMHDPQAQQALSQVNWTGEIKQTDGDYLHINDSNFAGGKSNLYVEEKVTYNIKVDSQGKTTNTVTIEYKNPQPFNTWLNGILRDYVRLYVPKGSTLVSSKGSDEKVNTQGDEDLNKTYFEAFITVRPQNSRVLSFEYTLPNKITDKKYPLLIQKQPGAKDYQYIVKINGSTKAEFDLTSDKQFNLSF
ncbi:MAG: DUF4012 domain-containing protein [Patescibacteria group bacterium]|nr:DUF4012 domain-containing protein [Patescibacteria group bacterium]